jgi:hypothetical protein
VARNGAGPPALALSAVRDFNIGVHQAKGLVEGHLWGERDLNPRPEDYEHSGPKRYAATRIQRVKSERGAPNTFLFGGGH